MPCFIHLKRGIRLVMNTCLKYEVGCIIQFGNAMV